jgi:hypothetical protein
MTSAYTIDHVQSLTATVDNWELLQDQLEYISEMSNWHRDEEDKIKSKLRRFTSQKGRESARYKMLLDCQFHHMMEYSRLTQDYQKFSPKCKEIEKVLEEEGLIESVIL